MFYTNILTVITLLAASVSAIPADSLQKREDCTCDKLHTTLTNSKYRTAASAFCSTYIQHTVTSTSTHTVSHTSTVTVKPSPKTTTKVDTITSTKVASSTSSYLETTSNTIYKRGTTTTKNIAGYPTFIAASYIASHVSSACSCLITPSKLKTSTVHRTITKTATVKHSTTLKPSTVTKTSKTTTILPTTTIISSPKDIYCNVYGTTNGANLITDGWDTVSTLPDCLSWCTGSDGCAMVHFGCADQCYCGLYSSNDLSQEYYMGSSDYGSAYALWDVECSPANATTSASPATTTI
ncbi:hypothetical protein NA57DRAFT_61473 [Rhizodiscina lignyota]|uniref:Apple domain-containing protein n=1 Tax=Rhizodiscina lignyota TaxID=1504668 RepID=A0A9P4I794_9PEZI|nr:hypothetical protein NA57DRAFT_61473 [Rhizodiscina lignyota]